MVKAEQEVKGLLKEHKEYLEKEVYGEKWIADYLSKNPTIVDSVTLRGIPIYEELSLDELEEIYQKAKAQGVNSISFTYNDFDYELTIEGNITKINTSDLVKEKAAVLTNIALQIKESSLLKELQEYQDYLKLKEKFDGETI